MLIFEGKEIETDTEGYLKESSQWSEPLAVVIAENEGISLHHTVRSEKTGFNRVRQKS